MQARRFSVDSGTSSSLGYSHKLTTSTIGWFLLSRISWHHAGAPVIGTYRVHPVGCKKYEARPVTHCQTVSETVRSFGSSIQCDTIWTVVHETPAVVARTKGFSPRGNPFRMIKVKRRCLHAMVMWKKPWFLSQGPVLGASCRRKMLTTDAFLTGWGAILEGRSNQGLWKDHHFSWHINHLEILAVFLTLKNLRADLGGHHVLVRSDKTSVVSYINRQGGLRSRPLCKLVCQLLLWTQGKLLSLREAYVPGVHNVGEDILSRQGLRPGEWRLHPKVVELIWREFSQAQVDLRLKRHLTVHSGFPSRIQLLWDRTQWYRRDQGYVSMLFPQSPYSREYWREFAGTGFY